MCYMIYAQLALVTFIQVLLKDDVDFVAFDPGQPR